MSAGKGPRVRPYDGTSVARSTSGGLSARATGTKGFGMLGHTGSHGRSMVARVRGAGGGDGGHGEFGCCFDLFDRVESSGWGESITFIGPWTFDSGSSASNVAAVDGNHASVTLPAQGEDEPGWATIDIAFDFDPDPTAGSLPMEMLVKFRLSSEVGAGNEPYVWFDWLHDGTGGSTEGTFTDVIIAGQHRLSASAYDVRGGTRATATTSWDVGTGWVSGAWYWARIVVDDWGTYIRAWKDGEDEFSHLAPVTGYSPTGNAGLGERWTAYDWVSTGRPAADFSGFRITVGAPYSGADFVYEFDEILARRGACDRWETCACGSDPERQWPMVSSTLYWDTAPFGDGPVYGYTTWLPGGDVAGFTMTRAVDGITVLWKCRVPLDPVIPIGYGGHARLMLNGVQVAEEYFLSPGGPCSPFWPQVGYPASSDYSYASWTGDVSPGDVFTVEVDAQPMSYSGDPIGTYYGQWVCFKAYLP